VLLGQPPGSTINIVNCQNIAVGEHAAAQSYAAKQMNDKSPPMFIEGIVHMDQWIPAGFRT